MQLGMIGLGRMGFNLSLRLLAHDHEVVVYDVNRKPIDDLAAKGATPADSIEDLVAKMTAPRSIWIMVPAAIAGDTVRQVAALVEPGDTVIDGGNTYYRDDIDRADELSGRGVHYVDIGTSGGVFGLERGFCLMIGGEDEPVRRLEPIFAAIAPGVDAAARTPGRTGEPTPEEQGWLHCGPVGAGHFVKMVHNGIEYGIMAAYAEGLAVLRRANIGKEEQEADAETAPLTHPRYYQYDIDTPRVTEVWRRGSVVASWLLDLTAAALVKDPQLSTFSGRVSDSGEGRWTVLAAVDEGVPAHVLTTALFERFSSRGESDYADRVLSAMRKEFGGHDEKKPAGSAAPDLER